MIFPNPKIKYYRVRAFGERLNVSFDYMRETWKPMLKFSLYLILPICLLQSFSINAIVRGSFQLEPDFYSLNGGYFVSFLIHYGVHMICILFGSAVLCALVYTLMQEYERRETRLLDIAWTEIKTPLINNIRKAIGALLLLTVIMLAFSGIIILLAISSPWTLLATIPLTLAVLLFVSVPFSMFLPVYLFENLPILLALRKTFTLTVKGWGAVFLAILVFGLLANIVSGVTTMPWYILTLVGTISGLTAENGIENRLWYQFLTYILGIIQSYGMYISAIITAIGYAFQYFHLREKQEGVSVHESIQNFDQL